MNKESVFIMTIWKYNGDINMLGRIIYGKEIL